MSASRQVYGWASSRACSSTISWSRPRASGGSGSSGAISTTVVRDFLDGATLDPGVIVSVIANCDAGEVLLSGGFTVLALRDQADLEKMVPIQSGPTSNPNEWQAQIVGTGSTTGLVELHAFVVCAVP
jgi:hypothetical protein